MRLVIQRVKKAHVSVDQSIVGKIDFGLVVFLGIHSTDDQDTIEWMVQKLINLRVFTNKQGIMDSSVKAVSGGILLISQFTLYGNCLKGRRPDFFQAAPADVAKPIYQQFACLLRKEIACVETGIFGAYMEVSSVNEGPMTLIIDSKERKN